MKFCFSFVVAAFVTTLSFSAFAISTVDPDDVDVDWVLLHEDATSRWDYDPLFADNSCSGWGVCNRWWASYNYSEIDSADDYKVAYFVDGTLPNDWVAYYYTTTGTLATAEYKTKGNGWANTSDYVHINNRDYSGGCAPKALNRIEWDYQMIQVGMFWVYTIDAVEVNIDDGPC